MANLKVILARPIMDNVRTALWKMLGIVKRRHTIRIDHGVFCCWTADQAIARELFVHKKFETEMIVATGQMLRERRSGMEKPSILVDVGANIGVVAIQALNLGLFERSIAIEPDPANFEMLCVNRDLNRLGDSLLCLECAVSSEKVSLSMQRNPKNFGDHRILRTGISGVTEDTGRSGPKVTGDTLDAVLAGHAGADLDRIGLIWIDIQGHEGEAILGGHETFSRDIPVMMELWPHGLAAAGFGEERFCQLLQTYWNEFWTWSETGFQPQGIAGIRELYATLVGVPGLYANVLMMKR